MLDKASMRFWLDYEAARLTRHTQQDECASIMGQVYSRLAQDLRTQTYQQVTTSVFHLSEEMAVRLQQADGLDHLQKLASARACRQYLLRATDTTYFAHREALWMTEMRDEDGGVLPDFEALALVTEATGEGRSLAEALALLEQRQAQSDLLLLTPQDRDMLSRWVKSLQGEQTKVRRIQAEVLQEAMEAAAAHRPGPGHQEVHV